MAKHIDIHSAVWRKLAYAGARYGPKFLFEYGPLFWGLFFAAILPDTRRRVLANLRRIAGRRRNMLKEQKDVAATFVNYAFCLAESLGIERSDVNPPQVQIEGKAFLEGLIQQQQSFILLTGHIGPWDSAAHLLARDYAMNVAVVMLREAHSEAGEIQDAVRRRYGVKVVHVGDGPLDALPLVHQLKKSGIVAFQLDRTPPAERTLQVRFCQTPFMVPEGPFRLAGATGAPLLPVFVRRTGRYAYQFRVFEPIIVAARSSVAELQVAAQACVSQMEQFIVGCPTQWFHFAS